MAGRESARADETAVPLDLLSTTSATGVARRMMPDASWSRFGLSLVSQPSTVAERAGSLGRELVSIAGHLGSGSGQGRQAFQRSGLAGQPPHEALHAGLSGRQ